MRGLRKHKLLAFLVAYLFLCSQQAMAQGIGGGIFGGDVKRAGDTMTGPLLLPDGTTAATSWGWSSDNDGTPTGMYRSSANVLDFVNNGTQTFNISTTRFSSVSNNARDLGTSSLFFRTTYTGRIVGGASTPSCSVSAGAGVGSSCAVGTGASDLSGRIVITAGTGAANTGTVTLTFSNGNGAYGTNTPACNASLFNGTGSWDTSANAPIGTAGSNTSVTWAWKNGAAATFTNTSTYSIHYTCVGM